MKEEERGVKLLNNLILVPFFCIINLSLNCAVYTEKVAEREVKTLKGRDE
jgi:hypothetical protein